MTRDKIPAVFIRGGTSKGVFFKAEDLPAGREERDRIFLEVIGSPDPYRRQLNGMGGGLSSVSKVVIVGPSERDDADLDYTFVQVAVDKPVADYGQACGNLSSAVGPFGVEEGLVAAEDGDVEVRIHNTNTNKIFHAHFQVRDGRAVERGDFEMAGVAGTGARIRLEYVRPAGANTAGLLPGGGTTDSIVLGEGEEVEVSLVDATNPVVFVAGASLDVAGGESPETLERNESLMSALDVIRRRGGVKMGLGARPQDVALSIPKVAVVTAPVDYRTIGGERVAAGEYDIGVRIVSMERMHRAVTGTGGMCLAAACQIPGSIPNRLARRRGPGRDIRIGTPSGIVSIAARVHRTDAGEWDVHSITVYRTQRRLMEGRVVLPRD